VKRSIGAVKNGPETAHPALIRRLDWLQSGVATQKSAVPEI
jgi:hypothetical protein